MCVSVSGALSCDIYPAELCAYTSYAVAVRVYVDVAEQLANVFRQAVCVYGRDCIWCAAMKCALYDIFYIWSRNSKVFFSSILLHLILFFSSLQFCLERKRETHTLKVEKEKKDMPLKNPCLLHETWISIFKWASKFSDSGRRDSKFRTCRRKRFSYIKDMTNNISCFASPTVFGLFIVQFVFGIGWAVKTIRYDKNIRKKYAVVHYTHSPYTLTRTEANGFNHSSIMNAIKNWCVLRKHTHRNERIKVEHSNWMYTFKYAGHDVRFGFFFCSLAILCVWNSIDLCRNCRIL